MEDLDATASKKRMRLVLPEQTIFEGSALRDLLLRGFQQTYIPYTASALDEDIHHGDQEGVVTVMEAPVPAAAGTSSPDDVNASQNASNGLTRRSSMLMRHPGLSDWVERHRGGGKAAHREGDPGMSLNESQTRAIAMMLGERLSLVQGVSCVLGADGLFVTLTYSHLVPARPAPSLKPSNCSNCTGSSRTRPWSLRTPTLPSIILLRACTNMASESCASAHRSAYAPMWQGCRLNRSWKSTRCTRIWKKAEKR